MKRTIAIMSIILFLSLGCAKNSTIGDGQVDEVETAIIQVAVGLAMNASPSTVVPAYAVSTALLQEIDSAESVTLAMIDRRLAKETANLKLTNDEMASFNELVGLVKAKIMDELELDSTSRYGDRKYIMVVRTVVEITNKAARARLTE